MKKEENVLKYYVLCNRLKNTIRTGWKNWNVERDRLESNYKILKKLRVMKKILDIMLVNSK